MMDDIAERLPVEPDGRMTVAAALAADTRPRVMLGLPTGDRVHMDYALSIAQLSVMSCLAVRISTANPRSCYVQTNRNDIVKQALGEGAEWIMWIDHDMEFPADGLIRLLRHQKDIVGATYVRRSPPYRLMGEVEDGGPAYLAMEALRPMKWIPAGFMLTRTSVFLKMKPPWFWLTHHENGDVHLGDDTYFCAKAREAGFTIWCDPVLTSEIKHHADMGLGPPQQALPGQG